MAKRHLVPILLATSIVTLLPSIWAIKNLPTSQSNPAPERPSIVSKVQSLDYTIQRARAQDSTNTRTIEHYQHELDSVLASPEYIGERAQYTVDSTRHMEEKEAQQSQEKTKVYSTFALYGLGVLSFLAGLTTAFARAHKD